MDFPTTWCICRQRKKKTGKSKSKAGKKDKSKKAKKAKKAKKQKTSSSEEESSGESDKSSDKKDKKAKGKAGKNQKKKKGNKRKEKKDKVPKDISPEAEEELKKQEARKKMKQDANKVGRVCYVISFVHMVSHQDFLPFKRWAGGEIRLHQIAKCTDLVGEAGWIVWLLSKKNFKIPTSDHRSFFSFIYLDVLVNWGQRISKMQSNKTWIHKSMVWNVAALLSRWHWRMMMRMN